MWDEDSPIIHPNAPERRKPRVPATTPSVAPLPGLPFKPSNPWPAALQNSIALIAVTVLTSLGHFTGNVAAGMILAILGVIAAPAILKKGPPGSIGILALCWKPLALALGSGHVTHL